MIHAGVAIERIISGNYAENIDLPDESFYDKVYASHSPLQLVRQNS